MNSYSTESTQIMEAPSKSARWVGLAPWAILFLILLAIFTVFKFPEAKIKSLIQGQLNAALAPAGISLYPREASFSLLFGLRYTMLDVRVLMPKATSPIELDRIRVSPSFLSLLTGKMGGTLLIEKDSGEMEIDFSASKSSFAADVDVDNIDLRKLGLLPAMTGMSAGAIVSGNIQAQGEPSSLSGLNGSLALDIKKAAFDEQAVGSGMLSIRVPSVKISDIRLEAEIVKGELRIKKLQLGKPGSGPSGEDDLSGTVLGKANLGRNLGSSSLDLELKFALSEKLAKVPMISIALGGGKLPDGSFHYKLTGPVTFPNFSPAGAP